MKTSKLHPELVEKMYSITSGIPFERIKETDSLNQDIKYGGYYSKQAEKCAQIAVDYCFETFVPLNQQLKDIKQQRDELIELIADFVETKESGGALNIEYYFKEFKQLLKKHES